LYIYCGIFATICPLLNIHYSITAVYQLLYFCQCVSVIMYLILFTVYPLLCICYCLAFGARYSPTAVDPDWPPGIDHWIGHCISATVYLLYVYWLSLYCLRVYKI
jgi:hypothetical protein